MNAIDAEFVNGAFALKILIVYTVIPKYNDCKTSCSSLIM